MKVIKRILIHLLLVLIGPPGKHDNAGYERVKSSSV